MKMNNRKLHQVVWREDGLFVAMYLELDIASQGRTKKEASKNLKEALELYLEDEDITKISLPAIEDVSTQTTPLTNA